MENNTPTTKVTEAFSTPRGAHRFEARLVSIEALLTKLDRQLNPPEPTLEELAEQFIPTRFPDYIADFKLTIEPAPNLGNGGGGELAVFSWMWTKLFVGSAGLGARVAYAYTDLNKGLDRLRGVGANKFWNDYLDAWASKVGAK